MSCNERDRGALAARPRPLEGLLVADFSRILSGPFATMMLGDLGATVVKVERPGTGDDTRAWGPPFVDGRSTYFLSVNRNKHGVALDLRDPEDHRRALALARTADVLVENFRPGTMERHGLGYEQLAPYNPKLVYCAISGFGRAAGRDLTGYDFLIQAVGGLMSITGQPEAAPTKVGVALVDVTSGLFATIGVLAALAERSRSGRGQRVDLNLLSSLLAVLVNQASGHLATGESPPRRGNEHPSLAPYELYACADQEIVIAAGNARQFASLATALGRPGLAQDPRFADNASRVEHRAQLRAELEDALAAGSADDWVARLTDAGVPCGQVNDLEGAFALADRLGLDPTFELDREDGSTVQQVSSPLTFSHTPVAYDQAPPDLGRDTHLLDELLARFGAGATTAPAAGGPARVDADLVDRAQPSPGRPA